MPWFFYDSNGNQLTATRGTLDVTDGGTGATSLTDGGVLLGSGTGAVTAMAVLADGAMIVGDGTTDPVAETGTTLRTSIGVGTGDSPQFTAVNIGNASDTTLARSSAGNVTIENNIIYRLGGQDVAVADGGTGASSASAAATALGVGTGDSPAFVDLTLTDDLLLTSSGAVINFNSGDMTITHGSNILTVAGGTFATAALTATTMQGTQVDILAQGDLRLQDTSGNQYVALQAAGTTTTHTLTFPGAVATTAGDVLSSSTGGVLSWTTPSAGVGLGLVIALGG